MNVPYLMYTCPLVRHICYFQLFTVIDCTDLFCYIRRISENFTPADEPWHLSIIQYHCRSLGRCSWTGYHCVFPLPALEECSGWSSAGLQKQGNVLSLYIVGWFPCEDYRNESVALIFWYEFSRGKNGYRLAVYIYFLYISRGYSVLSLMPYRSLSEDTLINK